MAGTLAAAALASPPRELSLTTNIASITTLTTPKHTHPIVLSILPPFSSEFFPGEPAQTVILPNVEMRGLISYKGRGFISILVEGKEFCRGLGLRHEEYENQIQGDRPALMKKEFMSSESDCSITPFRELGLDYISYGRARALQYHSTCAHV